MLILTRNPTQSIVIGNREIEIINLGVTYDEFGPIVTIGINADKVTTVRKGRTNLYVRDEAIRQHKAYLKAKLASADKAARDKEDKYNSCMS